jgi:hypothetical protein
MELSVHPDLLDRAEPQVLRGLRVLQELTEHLDQAEVLDLQVLLVFLAIDIFQLHFMLTEDIKHNYH